MADRYCEAGMGTCCYCYTYEKECCWCDLGLGNCKDVYEEEEEL